MSEIHHHISDSASIILSEKQQQISDKSRATDRAVTFAPASQDAFADAIMSML
jgi:hypothetical protein